MKKIISLLLVIAMVLSFSISAFAAGPKDIARSENKEAIETLYELGILEGYDGKFFPTDYLTRAEACAIIVRAMVDEEDIYESHKDYFTDVPEYEWYRPYVDTAYRNGYMHGHGDEFRPEDNMTYVQFATVVLNILGYNASVMSGTWPENAEDYADELKLYHNVRRHDNEDYILRQDVAQMLYNALEVEMVEYKRNHFAGTNETLKEYLKVEPEFESFIAQVYTISANRRSVEFTYVPKYSSAEATSYEVPADIWDFDIEEGDWVTIYYSYNRRAFKIEQVNFYYRPEVTLEKYPSFKGEVSDFAVDHRGNVTALALEEIGYLPITGLTVEDIEDYNWRTEMKGSYVYVYINSNGIVGYVKIIDKFEHDNKPGHSHNHNHNKDENPEYGVTTPDLGDEDIDNVPSVLPNDDPEPERLITIYINKQSYQDYNAGNRDMCWYHTDHTCSSLATLTETYTDEIAVEDIPDSWKLCTDCNQ